MSSTRGGRREPRPPLTSYDAQQESEFVRQFCSKKSRGWPSPAEHEQTFRAPLQAVLNATDYGAFFAAATAFLKQRPIALDILSPQSESEATWRRLRRPDVADEIRSTRELMWRHVMDCARWTKSARQGAARPAQKFLNQFHAMLSGKATGRRRTILHPVQAHAAYAKYLYRVTIAQNRLGRRRLTSERLPEIAKASRLPEADIQEFIYKDANGSERRWSAKQAARYLAAEELGIEVGTLANMVTRII